MNLVATGERHQAATLSDSRARAARHFAAHTSAANRCLHDLRRRRQSAHPQRPSPAILRQSSRPRLVRRVTAHCAKLDLLKRHLLLGRAPGCWSHRWGVTFLRPAPWRSAPWGRNSAGTKGAQGEALLRRKVLRSKPRRGAEGEFSPTLARTTAGATLSAPCALPYRSIAKVRDAITVALRLYTVYVF